MDTNGPLELSEVLRTEYQALRPDTEFSVGDTAELHRQAHQAAQPFSALCISGGGIRSATFALGVLQGFARHGVLERFDYLSTVSGGGYIGAWLSAWRTRARGLAKVIPLLCPDAPAPAPGKPDPVGHLREYNNYLTPKLGLFSADTWTVGATVVRNIALNWLVLIPLLMCALLVPRLVFSLLVLGDYYEGKSPSGENVTLSVLSEGAVVSWVMPALAAVLFACMIFNAARYLPSGGGRAHSQQDFLTRCLAPLIGAVVLFIVYYALHDWQAGDDWAAPDTTLLQVISWTVVPCFVGWLAFVVFCGKPIGVRLQLLGSRLSLAVLLTGVSAGVGVWLLTHKLFPSESWRAFAMFGPVLLLLSLDFAIGLFVGFTSNTLKDEDREWFARSMSWNLLASAVWIGACALVLQAPSWAFDWNVWGKSVLGVVGAVSAWACTLPGPPGGAVAGRAVAGGGLAGAGTIVKGLALKIAPLFFLVSLSVGLAMLTNWLFAQTGTIKCTVTIDTYWQCPVSWTEHQAMLLGTPWWLVAAVALALFVFSMIMARYVNVNIFSLHAMYRSRLIRAYIGASNAERYAARSGAFVPDGSPVAGSQAASFTGFVESDNLGMHELREDAPLHVVNVALNLVSTKRLAWQQRKAQSFTITPFHCGNYELGYRPSSGYGGEAGISLGTAVTISGAAASPNMGYHSSAVIGFIMTMFNARLGAWLGNPGAAGTRSWRRAGPRFAVASLLKEAFGLTTNESPYVYLSDGGHFENLALYEMVLRRCRFIVVLDSGCDPDFGYEDLGNALRKVRIDLRVPISFKEPAVAPLQQRTKRCAVARIHYSSVDDGAEDGWLVYIKPMICLNEPPDVLAYHNANPAFPHQTTGDQWFDESQTESYRMLGLHTVEEICEGWRGGSLEEFVQHVEQVYLGVASPNTGPVPPIGPASESTVPTPARKSG